VIRRATSAHRIVRRPHRAHRPARAGGGRTAASHGTGATLPAASDASSSVVLTSARTETGNQGTAAPASLSASTPAGQPPCYPGQLGCQ
jgi:hypothetical protein